MNTLNTPTLSQPIHQGKIRSLYRYSDTMLLMVAGDRISAYDTIMRQEVPGKGALLNGLSQFWFTKLADLIDNHYIACSGKLFDQAVSKLMIDKSRIGGAMLIKKAQPIAMECVVRGYITGAAWREYQLSQTVNGAKLQAGLKVDQQLPQPIFTPSTKATSGHDLPLTRAEGERFVGAELFAKLEGVSIGIYRKAYEYALQRGMILADTKFEFGFSEDGSLLLIDELLTPDSSRWWDLDGWEAGKVTPPMDKQFLRYWLDENWTDRSTPPPDLPQSVIEETRNRYSETYRRLTGKEFETEHKIA